MAENLQGVVIPLTGTVYTLDFLIFFILLYFSKEITFATSVCFLAHQAEGSKFGPFRLTIFQKRGKNVLTFVMLNKLRCHAHF